ncbi:MAG TPA: hypothetical protein VFK10_10370, partial [Burkholderiaceae bacterium]|nr:hypothetical protein [Burkholderiaceae bacterium]
AGYALATYAARAEVIEGNEAKALERARASAIVALGEAACAQAQADGATLCDADIASLAFGSDDVPAGARARPRA